MYACDYSCIVGNLMVCLFIFPNIRGCMILCGVGVGYDLPEPLWLSSAQQSPGATHCTWNMSR